MQVLRSRPGDAVGDAFRAWEVFAGDVALLTLRASVSALVTGESAEAAIAEGHADAIAFCRIFISNADLPRRLQHGYSLTPCNRATFYGGEEAGYTGYPVYEEVAPA